MVFEPGNKLAQGGRKEKPFRDALMLAIKETDGDRLKLRKVADALVTKAETGDVSAIKEIADRLDGKPIQQTEHSGLDGGPLILSWMVQPQANG